MRASLTIMFVANTPIHTQARIANGSQCQIISAKLR